MQRYSLFASLAPKRYDFCLYQLSAFPGDEVLAGFRIGLSDYQTNGDVIVYDEAGHFVTRFDAQDLNPQKVLVFGK